METSTDETNPRSNSGSRTWGTNGEIHRRRFVNVRRAAYLAAGEAVPDELWGKLEPAERDAVLARISATDHLGRLAECDLVIESVVEDLDVKRALFAALDEVVKPEALASRSTVPVSVVMRTDAWSR